MIQNLPVLSSRCPSPFAAALRPGRPIAQWPCAFALLALLEFLPRASAQQVNTVVPYVPCIYVAAHTNYDSYTNNTARLVISGGANPVNVTFPSLPAGMTASLLPPHDTNNFTTSTTFRYKLACANVSPGQYALPIRARDTVTSETSEATVNLVVASAFIATEASPSTDWSTPANWSTGGSPTTGDDVLFYVDLCASSNMLGSSATLNSLAYLRNNVGATNTTILAPGVTLAVTGTPGFIAGVDGVPGGLTGSGGPGQDNKNITYRVLGTGGASLLVSNQNATFCVGSVNGGNDGTRLDLSGLDHARIKVSRLVVGDPTSTTAGAVGAELVRYFALARTNLIRTSFVGDYTTSGVITNAISLFSDFGFNNGSACNAYLGITNAIFADSLAVAQCNSGGDATLLRFHPSFMSNNCVAYIRGADGGRMALLGVGIDSGTTASTARTRGNIDFSGGTVDLLADTIWLGRTRTNYSGVNQQCGRLLFNRGIIDVNTLIAGYKAYATSNYCFGVVVVSSNAASLVVNNQLILGYTPPGTNTPASEQTYGRLIITNYGTVRANAVVCGDLSTNNSIEIRTGGMLLVTNAIGSEAVRLARLDMSGGVLAVAATGTGAKAYVTNLIMGNPNTIKLTSVEGLTTFPHDLPVISWVNRTPANQNFSTDVSSLPAGYSAFVLDDVANQMIYLRVSTNPPRTLHWRGYVNANWDTGTSNWLDAATSSQTTFINGDNVVFDDTPGVPTTVFVASDVTPGQSALIPGMAFTNSDHAYTLSSSGGSILGSARLVKEGTNTLTLEGYGEYSAQVNQGLVILAASGTAGSAAVATNAAFQCAGTLIGRLTSAGGAWNSGTINGGAALIASALTNAGTINGNLSVAGASILHNLDTGVLNDFGSVSFPTNSLLINEGALTGGALNITGTFRNSSAQDITLSTSLIIGNRGNFIPDGDTMGTLRVVGQGNDNNAGRIIFDTGSTNFFKVDPGSGSNTKVLAARHGFGPNQNTKQINGGMLVITNVGAAAFAAGQSFKLFGNMINDGNVFDAGLNTTNSYPLMSPPAPGPGLAWDLSNLMPGGVIGIRAVSTTPLNLGVAHEPLVAVSTNDPPVTNRFIVSTVTWPASHLGWRLLSQRNELTTGLSTNWIAAAESLWTNRVVVTNALAPGSVFFRMVYP